MPLVKVLQELKSHGCIDVSVFTGFFVFVVKETIVFFFAVGNTKSIEPA